MYIKTTNTLMHRYNLVHKYNEIKSILYRVESNFNILYYYHLEIGSTIYVSVINQYKLKHIKLVMANY